MTKDNTDQATQFESLTRRFLTAWQLRAPGHLGPLTMTEFRAMVTVDERREATMSEIAKSLGLTLGATTSVVDRLVTSGLVQRQHDMKDRRVVRVKVTPEGLDATAKIVRSMTDDLAKILQRIPPEGRASFLETYRQIVDVAEREPEGRASPA